MAAKVPKFARTDPTGSRAPLEPVVAIRCQAVAIRFQAVAIRFQAVAIRCQAVESGASKPLPSGDRWLRPGEPSRATRTSTDLAASIGGLATDGGSHNIRVYLKEYPVRVRNDGFLKGLAAPELCNHHAFLFASQVLAMSQKVAMWTGFPWKLCHPLSQLCLQFGY